MDQRPPKDDEKQIGKLIAFPGGKSLTPDEVGADYVVEGVPAMVTPELVDPDEFDRENRARANYVKGQELVALAKKSASTEEWIDALLIEIAEESAHLKFERRKASKEGKSTANMSVLHSGVLRTLMETLLKRKEAALAERLDLKSPRFQKILGLWMDLVYNSMQKAGVGEEIIDLVFNQIKTDLLDWETKITDALCLPEKR